MAWVLEALLNGADRLAKWSSELIISDIRTLRDGGEDLSYTGAVTKHGALYRAALRRFGSWRHALGCAGLNPGATRRRRRWTAEGVVEEIRALARDGSDLSWSGVAEGRQSLAAAARARFGSWRAGLAAAGLSEVAGRRQRRWDRHAVVAAVLQRASLGLGMSASCVERDDASLIGAARRHLGSWPRALKAAGIEPASVVLRSRDGGGA